ncbi:MAG TPA: hypothetical protein VF167_02295 [Longimicrobiaceae bacterium]
MTVVHVTLYTPAMLHENRYARYPYYWSTRDAGRGGGRMRC